MDKADESKKYRDPLMAELDSFRAERKRARSEAPPSAEQRSRAPFYALGVFLIATLSILGYFLFEAQSQIRSLSSDLSENQEHLGQVSAELGQSKERIEELNKGLDEGKQKLDSQGRVLNQYKGLYENLKDEQQLQTMEIASLNQVKADQSEVNRLKGESTVLKEQLEETGTQVQQTREELSRLDERTADNTASIDRTRGDLEQVRSATQANAGNIDQIRRSLEREYYNFELQEGSGYMKVFNIALSLKDTDIQKRQFDLYLMADGKIIQKKNQSVNEPILFYVEGQEKAYEVVVTRVDRKLAVGYLSVPKS